MTPQSTTDDLKAAEKYAQKYDSNRNSMFACSDGFKAGILHERNRVKLSKSEKSLISAMKASPGIHFGSHTFDHVVAIIDRLTANDQVKGE